MHDSIRTQRNEHQFMHNEDWDMDLKLYGELRTWKGRFTISFVMNLLLIGWVISTRSI